MNAKVTADMLQEVINLPHQSVLANGDLHTLKSTRRRPTTALMQNLKSGMNPPETDSEVAKLTSALSCLSPDVARGNGSFFDHDSKPVVDYWLGVVWAIASLRWMSGKEIARNWSKQASSRYTDNGFEESWASYNPNRERIIGIGSLYKRAKQLGWSPESSTVHENIRQLNPYKLLSSSNIHALPQLKQTVKGIFPAQGFGVIFGPSQSGKSFLAFDLATAIAQGTKWFGHRVTQAPVIYVILEGESGVKQRVEAWEKVNNQSIPSDMYIIIQSFKLTDITDVNNLAAITPQGSVIIIDTLNRSAPTIDENSSGDMGCILESIKTLQKLINGLVIIVHHTGKDATKGARGHSSLFAAMDGAIEVERNINGRSWSVAKSKDGKDGQKTTFKLVVHDLGNDSDGDTRTSCTVELGSGQIFQRPEPTGKRQKAAFKSIKEILKTHATLGRGGAGSHIPCMRMEELIVSVADTLVTTQKSKRTNNARAIVQSLCDAGYLGYGAENDEGWVWVK